VTGLKGDAKPVWRTDLKVYVPEMGTTISKLDFIIAGTQKSGTSVLTYYLNQHPAIAMAHKEEAHLIVQPRRHFFDNEGMFASGNINYDLLHRDVPVTAQTLVSGTCTPVYTYWKPAMQRIHDYNPSIKLIILLRNPIDRAFSHWNMQRDRKLDSLDFLDAVKQEENRAREAYPLQLRKFSYVERGFYSDQMERVFRFFSREQVLVIKFDDLRRDYRTVTDRIFNFLGVPPFPRLKNREENVINYARPMTQSERHHLYSIFRDDIAKLEQLLGWDCSDWKPSSVAAR
jgi:Sulfotransferase domain